MIYIDRIQLEYLKLCFINSIEQEFKLEKDNQLSFYTDGSFIYAIDMDNKEIDPFIDDINIADYYKDFTLFLNIFKEIEVLLGYELFVSDWNNNKDKSIRQLELEYNANC